MFGIFASFRQVLSDHGFLAAFFYVLENFSFSWLDLSSSELGAPFRSMIDVREDWFIDGFRFGSSYVHAFINIFPSSIVNAGESFGSSRFSE